MDQPPADDIPGEEVPFDDLAPPAWSEDQLALQFAAAHEGELCYVAGWGKWMRWRGTHWAADDTLEAFDRIRPFVRLAAIEVRDAGDSKADRIARDLASKRTISAIEHLARADRRIAATVDIWDRNPMLLATPGGCVDLTTGEIRPADPFEYCASLTAVAPEGGSSAHPVWSRFLERVTDGDKDLESYLQRLAGYCLTGDTTEHRLYFLHGDGRNGKGTWLNTLQWIMGSYAATAAMEAFLDARNDRHSTELAMLRSARLVVASETEKGRNWAEARIKQLTGGDLITARYMRQDHFTYRPQFKLVFMGNHLPRIQNASEAMRSRIAVVPFDVTIPRAQRDKQLPDRLKEEASAILGWMIEGCRQRQQNGLSPVGRVADATARYFAEGDRMGQWIESACAIGPGAGAGSTELHDSWTHWCAERGEDGGSQTAFATALKDRGFKKKRGSSGRWEFLGIDLRVHHADRPRFD